jgi:transcriptional regulator with GAF, ATPase, and Fis domain
MSEPWKFTASSQGREQALSLAKRVAASSCSILIMGPTGVGKDVLAEDIHQHSRRAERPFVALNCAAIPAALFESELFGHARGSYTGAMTAKPGYVEIAAGGTLFLDEVGELSTEAQAKLLRFLAKGMFWPVGAVQERAVDIRVIAATNRALPTDDGSFRDDLLFRLGEIVISIPPIEPGDVRVLAVGLAQSIAARDARDLARTDVDTLATLAAGVAWRGGVRELRGALERFFLLRAPGMSVAQGFSEAAAAGVPTASRPAPDLPPPAPAGLAPSALIEGFESLVFLAAAGETASVRELAQRLNRTPQAVYVRLKKLGLRPRDLGRSEILRRTGDVARAKLSSQTAWIRAILQGE